MDKCIECGDPLPEDDGYAGETGFCSSECAVNNDKRQEGVREDEAR